MKAGDWVIWRPGLSSHPEKMGQVFQVAAHGVKVPIDSEQWLTTGILVRELIDGELREPPQFVYNFQVRKTDLSPLEVLGVSVTDDCAD